MPRFEVITPHNDAECLKALDEVVAHNPSLLQQFWFGCKSGDHTGFALMDAKSESDKAISEVTQVAEVVSVERSSRRSTPLPGA